MFPFFPDGLDNRLFCGNISVVFDQSVEDDEVFLFNLTTADSSRIAIAQSIYEVTITDSTGNSCIILRCFAGSAGGQNVLEQ